MYILQIFALKKYINGTNLESPPLFFSLSDPFLQKPSALAGKAPRPSGVKPVCVWGAPAELGALLCSVIALHPTL